MTADTTGDRPNQTTATNDDSPRASDSALLPGLTLVLGGANFSADGPTRAVAALAGAPRLYLDTEFRSAKGGHTLSLVQATTGDEVWGTVRNDAAEQAARAAGAHRVERLDLGDQSSIEAFGALVRDAVDSIDVLINNAGLNSGALGVEDRRAQGPLLTTGPVVLRQIEVNAVGPMLLTQQLHPLLLAAEHRGSVSLPRR